jgi:cell division transport system permease protein
MFSRGGIGYFIKEGLQSTIKNGVMSVASISVLSACLLIMGSFLMVSENISNILSDLEQQNELVVFIDENLDEEQTQQVGEKIKTFANIKSIEFFSKEEALEEWKADMPDAEAIFAGITENPLRNSYRIFLDDLSRMEETTSLLKKDIPEIVNIRGRLDVSQNLIRLKNILALVMMWLFVVLVVISVFIISNTIRVAMFARRKEINIMKHVGATDWFILWPFLFEGIFIGGLSGLAAFGMQIAIYTYISEKVLSGIELIRLMPVAEFFPQLLIGFLTVGIVIGSISSTFSVRKHLNA